MERGLFARTAETIGMAQRGGSVVSHVRFGTEIYSPMIAPGGADVLIGSEPGEAVRNLAYLRPDGLAVVCDRAVFPVVAALGGGSYDGEAMLAYLEKRAARLIILRAADVEKACGTLKTLNIALLGAAVASGALGIPAEAAAKALAARVKPAYLELNLNALSFGAKKAGECP